MHLVTVHGAAFRPDGQPAANALVTARNLRGAPTFASSTWCDENGDWELEIPADMLVRLRCNASGLDVTLRLAKNSGPYDIQDIVDAVREP
jgi:hypothetical protein